jgi:adenine-specific DNA-methyltransferase
LRGWKFRRQIGIGPYIADFVCSEARLVLEIDGSQHVERADYDEQRTAAIEALGYRVLRLWNHDVLARTDQVLDAIAIALDERK